MNYQKSRDLGRWFGFSVAGAIASAVATSGTILALSCCAGPIVLLSFGFSGAMIGNLQALAPFKPLIMILTLGFLGLAFYHLYRKKTADCDTQSCSSVEKNRTARTIFWIGVALTTVLIIGPYLLDIIFQRWTGGTP